MSLLVWLPLNGDLKNLGLSPAKFSINTSASFSSTGTGKIAQYSYARSAINTAGYITSDINFYFPKDFSMCCWVKVNTVANTTTANGIITHHDHNIGGAGITLKVSNASTCYASCNTGTNGSNRTYHTYYGTTNIFGAWHHIGLTYDRSNTKYKLYVDGVIEKEFTYGDTAAPRPFQLFNWSTSYNANSYRPAVQLNDVRLYDNCISEKEMKEIAQGLVAHYPLRDSYIEMGANLVKYPTPGSSATSSYAWNTTLHDKAIAVSNWSSGYNSGVTSPSAGYHAHWQLIDNEPVAVFPNINSIYSLTGRWLGISSHSFSTNIPASTTYTISLDVKGSTTDCAIRAGLYYYNTSNSRTFHDGYLNEYCTTSWRRVSKTFTTSSATDASKAMSLYLYGHNYGEGVIYVKNLKIEIGDHATAYTKSSFSKNTLAQDCSGYGHHGTVMGTPKVVEIAGGRNQYSTKFNGTTDAIACGRGPMVTDALTVNLWAYKNDWSTGTTAERFISCTQTGGWNFEYQNKFICYSNGAYQNAVSSTNFTALASGWHMFTGTYDGKQAKIYIDGILKGSSTALSAKYPITYNANNGIFIGGEAEGTQTSIASGYFPGNLSDVRIYGTALNANDILAMYQDAAHIDNHHNLRCYEIIENNGININQDGSVVNGTFSNMAELHNMKIKHLDDGSAWARIFWHDVSSEKQWFTNATEVQDCEKFNRFSKMGIADKFISKKVNLTNMIPRPVSGKTGFASAAVAVTSPLKYPGGVALQITGTTSTAEVTANSTVTAHYIPGHTYYARMEVYQTTIVGGAQIYWKVAEPSMGSGKATTANAWNTISYYRTAATIVNRNGVDWDEGDYAYRIDFDNSKTAGTMTYDGLMLIDLTAAFGAGREPTQAWCDANIPFFTGTTTIDASNLSGGWYEFMLTYPRLSSTKYNRWRQTSKPSASASTGYEAIQNSWASHAGGLRKTNGSAVYNCDSVGSSTWYAAIGQTTPWTSTQYIPAADGSSQTETELWVRIDNLGDVEKTNLYEDLTTSVDFIEF